MHRIRSFVAPMDLSLLDRGCNPSSHRSCKLTQGSPFILNIQIQNQPRVSRRRIWLGVGGIGPNIPRSYRKSNHRLDNVNLSTHPPLTAWARADTPTAQPSPLFKSLWQHFHSAHLPLRERPDSFTTVTSLWGQGRVRDRRKINSRQWGEPENA